MEYPLKHREHREFAVSRDICPKCGGALDEGYECNSCGYDAIYIVRKMPKLKEEHDGT